MHIIKIINIIFPQKNILIPVYLIENTNNFSDKRKISFLKCSQVYINDALIYD